MSLVSDWYNSLNEGWKRILFIIHLIIKISLPLFIIGGLIAANNQYHRDDFNFVLAIILPLGIYYGFYFSIRVILNIFLWVREGFHQKK